jgi:hypothetical protein
MGTEWGHRGDKWVYIRVQERTFKGQTGTREHGSQLVTLLQAWYKEEVRTIPRRTSTRRKCINYFIPYSNEDFLKSTTMVRLSTKPPINHI